ncbi:MAG: arginine--tRNA ligase [Bacteroidota bacterium]
MIEQKLKQTISLAFKNCFFAEVDADKIALEKTSSDYEGDFTFVVFSYLKQSKKNPEQTANDIGNYVKENLPEVASFNVIKGFLNFSLTADFWIQFLKQNYDDQAYGIVRKLSGQKILVEYSSPNTNKPLHLGHVRNNLLGYAVANILKANGHQVTMCNLVNDRGIHICKSMLAWIKFGNGETPESAGMKGDHLVGKYYVEFDKQYKKEVLALEAKGINKDEAEKKAPSIIEAQQLLQKWEAGDKETVEIWKMMNDWVYAGFDTTYKKLGVRFDKFYYESNTYILGKEIVQEGLSKNVFFKKDDGSVWVDLTDDGLDQKLLLRGDGTSVYITQDIGTAELKYNDFGCERSIYVVGNEQDYHFKVLQLICKKLSKSYADGIYHLSYGMVELPQGKMKSREGTVVDADDLMDEMINTAKDTTIALGKTEGLNEEELQKLYETIGLGALKYFLLKVEPKRKMMFNPEESIDFQGNTGPFIQYTHARIKSILKNVEGKNLAFDVNNIQLHSLEKNIIDILHAYPSVIVNAGKEMSPGLVANYVYELAKSFSQLYHELSILKENNTDQRNLRIMICMFTANIIRQGFNILGINVPERM